MARSKTSGSQINRSPRSMLPTPRLEALEPKLLLNAAPTDVSLSVLSIPENQPTGTVVGTLSTTDPDADDTFTYTLVLGSGSTNNSSFTIDGNLLKTATSFNYESASTTKYIRVRAADSAGNSFTKAFEIAVENVNEAMYVVRLSDTWLVEGQPAGTAVGILSTYDVDSEATDPHTYTLVDGDGGQDNALFTIEGNELRSTTQFTYEGYNAYHVRIRSTDSGGLQLERPFTITVIPSDVTAPMAVLDPMLPVESAMKLVVSQSQATLGAAAIGCDADGRSLVVWASFNGGDASLLGCFYDADGHREDAPFVLANGIAADGSSAQPALAMAADGRFLLGWRDSAGAIRIRGFTRDGVAANAATSVATPSGTITYDWPAIAVDAQGNGVIIWRVTGSTVRVAGRATGVGGHVGTSTWQLITSETVDAGVSVCMLTSGQFMLGWTAASQGYVRRYNANGTAQENRIQLPSWDAADSAPVLVSHPGGAFSALVRHREYGPANELLVESLVAKLYVPHFSNTFDAVGSVELCLPQTGHQLLPPMSVAALSTGGLALCWGETDGQSGTTQVFTREFTASRVAVEDTPVITQWTDDYTFTVTYTDAGGVDPTSLDDLDIRVTEVPDRAGQWVLDGVLDLSSVWAGTFYEPEYTNIAIDGNIAVVGGAARVGIFERGDSGQWTQTYTFSTGFSTNYPEAPYAVAVQGTTVVVGCYWPRHNEGGYLIQKSPTGQWSSVRMPPSQYPVTGCFGVDISGDSIVLGSGLDWSPWSEGPVVYARNADGTYSASGSLLPPDPTGVIPPWGTELLYGHGAVLGEGFAAVQDGSGYRLCMFENGQEGWQIVAELPTQTMHYYGLNLEADGSSVYASGTSVREWRRNSDGMWWLASDLPGIGDVAAEGNWLATRSDPGSPSPHEGALRLYQRQPDGSWGEPEDIFGFTGNQVAMGGGRVGRMLGSKLYIYARPELISSGYIDVRAELVTVTAVEGGYRATYRVAAPPGGWDSAANDTYAIWLEDGQVADVNGNLSYGGMLGTFKVSTAQPASVLGRYVFYNHSALDGNNAAANAADDAAIAGNKCALRPGVPFSSAVFTSYARGINGIMVDIANLAGTPTANDFLFTTGNSSPDTWVAAASPVSITVRYGAGISGSDRVTIVWADGAIQDGWLRVEVLATPYTGLTQRDLFYWGNIRGDTTGDGKTNVFDLLNVRTNYLKPADDPTRDSRADVNMDGNVNVFDLLLVQQNYMHELYMGEPGSFGLILNAPAEPVPAAVPLEGSAGEVESRSLAALDEPARLPDLPAIVNLRLPFGPAGDHRNLGEPAAAGRANTHSRLRRPADWQEETLDLLSGQDVFSRPRGR